MDVQPKLSQKTAVGLELYSKEPLLPVDRPSVRTDPPTALAKITPRPIVVDNAGCVQPQSGGAVPAGLIDPRLADQVSSQRRGVVGQLVV